MNEQTNLKFTKKQRSRYTYIIIDPVDMSRGYEAKLMILCKKHKCILYKFEEKFLIYKFVYGVKMHRFIYKNKEFKSTSRKLIEYLQSFILTQSGYHVSPQRLSNNMDMIPRDLANFAMQARKIGSGATVVASPRQLMVRHARSKKFKNIMVIPAQHVKTQIKSDHTIEMRINRIIDILFPLLGIKSDTILEDIVRADLELILVNDNQKITEKRELRRHEGNIRIEM